MKHGSLPTRGFNRCQEGQGGSVALPHSHTQCHIIGQSGLQKVEVCRKHQKSGTFSISSSDEVYGLGRMTFAEGSRQNSA